MELELWVIEVGMAKWAMANGGVGFLEDGYIMWVEGIEVDEEWVFREELVLVEELEWGGEGFLVWGGCDGGYELEEWSRFFAE